MAMINSMTNRGGRFLEGQRAVIDPFMDNGKITRIPISVDNKYNRGRIPAFSLWAPSDRSSNPWKYMPYMPPINIVVANSTTSLDIPNEWVDYFRVGDEIIVFDTSTAADDNLAFRGKSSDDISAVTLGTDSCTVSAVGVEDSGATGNVLLTLSDALKSEATGGALGTGDLVVLAGYSTSVAHKSYQQAENVVIMEKPFQYDDGITGTVGEGGYLVESAVYRYDGRIDTNYIDYYANLNTFDATPALTVATKLTNHTRFDFESIYRG